MKAPPADGGERAWTSAWDAFAVADAAAAPPADLEPRVLDAVRRAQAASAIHGRRRIVQWSGALLAAAAVVIVAAGVAGLRHPRIEPATHGSHAVPPVEAAHEEPRVLEEPTRASRERLESAAPIHAVNRDATVDAVPLAMDLMPPPETVQLVRIRMPVAALAALGIATMGPDASGEVDVDVTVGDDGLARDIRGIHAVPAAERQ